MVSTPFQANQTRGVHVQGRNKFIPMERGVFMEMERRAHQAGVDDEKENEKI